MTWCSWVHEVYRVYYDRLIDDSDRHWLFELIQKMVKAHFKDDFQTIFKHLAAGSKVTDDDLRSLMFGDYMKPDAVRWQTALINLTCKGGGLHVNYGGFWDNFITLLYVYLGVSVMIT